MKVKLDGVSTYVFPTWGPSLPSASPWPSPWSSSGQSRLTYRVCQKLKSQQKVPMSLQLIQTFRFHHIWGILCKRSVQVSHWSKQIAVHFLFTKIWMIKLPLIKKCMIKLNYSQSAPHIVCWKLLWFLWVGFCTKNVCNIFLIYSELERWDSNHCAILRTCKSLGNLKSIHSFT